MEIRDVVGKFSSTLFETGKQVSNIVTEKAKEAKGYAKDAMDMATLKNQIASCEDIIKNSYQILGEYYYKKYEENPEAEVVESVRAIDNAKATIKELEAKIQEIKDSQVEIKAAKEAAAEDAKATVADEAEELKEDIQEVSESVDDELDQIKKDNE